MTRIVIIGIDSMDIDLVHQYLQTLPNISRIIRDGMELRFVSTLPPDSVTAWASIYTGMTPAEHGLVFFADPLDKIEATVVNEIDNTSIRGRTFWDKISMKGKRVCVINPHLGYPPWEVNGVMIGRSNINKNVECTPKEYISSDLLDRLKIISEIPTRRTRRNKINECENLIRNELEVAKYLFNQEKWDLFFIYSSVLDYVEHYFWSFCDPNDPAYLGKNEFEHVIRKFYEIYDHFIGEIASLIEKDQEIIILSDHGHGMRPNEIINFNQLLRKEGFLTIKSDIGKSVSTKDKAKEMMKIYARRSVNEFGLGNFGMKLLRTFPSLRKRIMISSLIDWDHTIAYVSDQSGMKAYSYGGIIIRSDRVNSKMDYENIRNKIIDILNNLKYKDTDEKVVKWCGRREDLYLGKYVTKYPDIIVELRDGIGFGWEIEGDLYSYSDYHSIAPGSHKRSTPVLILSKNEFNWKENEQVNPDQLHDIILDHVEK